MKTLVVYYSYSGNTKKVVDMIKEKKNFDVLKIKPVNDYSDDYQKVVDDEEAKMDMNEIIEIKDVNVNLDYYDRILLGTGVWWYKITPAIRSFLNKYDLKDKVIVPFITNGGWLGEALDDVKRYAKESTIKDAITIKFNGNTMEDTNKVKSWIEGL